MPLFNDFTISGSGYVHRTASGWTRSPTTSRTSTTVNPSNQPAFSESVSSKRKQQTSTARAAVSRLSAVQHGDWTGTLALRPDESSMPTRRVTYVAPDINLSDQMTNLILAQRGYQANAQAIDTARKPPTKQH